MIADSAPETFARYRLAARVAVWICAQTFVVRFRPLPVVLQRIGRDSLRAVSPDALDPDDVARIVARVSQLPIFRLRIFPRTCVRRSLALYKALSSAGHPAVIHVGVRKHRSAVEGHTWVTLHGAPLAEPDPLDAFTPIYSYPPFNFATGR